MAQLTELIEGLPDALVDGGRAVIISFHSLEDRIVKHCFRDDPRLRPLTRRPLIAAEDEQAENRRARSAKLRAAERVARTEDPEEDLDEVSR